MNAKKSGKSKPAGKRGLKDLSPKRTNDAKGGTKMLEPAEDVYYKPYDGKSQIESAMRDYLEWELALLEQIKRDPDCRFRDYP